MRNDDHEIIFFEDGAVLFLYASTFHGGARGVCIRWVALRSICSSTALLLLPDLLWLSFPVGFALLAVCGSGHSNRPVSRRARPRDFVFFGASYR